MNKRGTNAKLELQSVVNGERIICAKISVHPSIYDESDKVTYLENGWNTDSFVIDLKHPHTEKELEEFINKLDFYYDNGYGSQELGGVVWLEDAWLTRGEYDGSEWWDYNRYPDIPEELKNIQLDRENKINSIV